MQMYPGEILHIYNRGNNKQRIFFSPANYELFKTKMRDILLPVADVMAYCLMPNHFHVMVRTTEKSIEEVKIGSLVSNKLRNAIRIIQSSYAQAINKENNFSGSLFQQKTKYKALDSVLHQIVCFHYLHQNPLKAALVKRLEDWRFSSFQEYAKGNSDLCNIEMTYDLFGFTQSMFLDVTYGQLSDDMLDCIF
jgi:putative transposase